MTINPKFCTVAELHQMRERAEKAEALAAANAQKALANLETGLKYLAERDRAIAHRKSTQLWYAGRYGKLEDWARKILPEPWCTQFFSCVANGLYDSVKDVGEPYTSQVGRIVPSGYFKMETAQEQILHDQSTRAEIAAASLETARTALTAIRDIVLKARPAEVGKSAQQLIEAANVARAALAATEPTPEQPE